MSLRDGTCSRCGGDLPRGRRDSYCVDCRREFSREWMRRNRESSVLMESVKARNEEARLVVNMRKAIAACEAELATDPPAGRRAVLEGSIAAARGLLDGEIQA